MKMCKRVSPNRPSSIYRATTAPLAVMLSRGGVQTLASDYGPDQVTVGSGPTWPINERHLNLFKRSIDRCESKQHLGPGS
jgi:phage terminase large subunit-like protein